MNENLSQNNNDSQEELSVEEETLEMLKNRGISIKGASRAFTIAIILWQLTKEDTHGYLLMKKIDEFFETQIELGSMKQTKANKIYPLLKSMQEYGLIEAYPGIHNKKQVKIYRLTEDGYKTYDLIKTQVKTGLKRDIWKKFFNDLCE